jgi:hypothetical protein
MVEVLLFRETVGETGINNSILDVYNPHRLPLPLIPPSSLPLVAAIHTNCYIINP